MHINIPLVMNWRWNIKKNNSYGVSQRQLTTDWLSEVIFPGNVAYFTILPINPGNVAYSHELLSTRQNSLIIRISDALTTGLRLPVLHSLVCVFLNSEGINKRSLKIRSVQLIKTDLPYDRYASSMIPRVWHTDGFMVGCNGGRKFKITTTLAVTMFVDLILCLCSTLLLDTKFHPMQTALHM